MSSSYHVIFKGSDILGFSTEVAMVSGTRGEKKVLFL